MSSGTPQYCIDGPSRPYFGDLFTRHISVKRDKNVVLDALIRTFKGEETFRALFKVIGVKLKTGSETKLIVHMFDVRTASVEVYGLRQIDKKVDWREQIKALPLQKAPETLQNTVRVLASPFLTAEAVAAGMRVRGAMESVELSGYLPEGQRLELSPLYKYFECVAYEQFYL